MKKVILLGEPLMRLSPEGNARFLQADRMNRYFGGGRQMWLCDCVTVWAGNGQLLCQQGTLAWHRTVFYSYTAFFWGKY